MVVIPMKHVATFAAVVPATDLFIRKSIAVGLARAVLQIVFNSINKMAALELNF